MTKINELIVAFAYIAVGFSMVLANQHKNNFFGNVCIIIAWPSIVLAMLIRKVFK